MPGGSVIQDRQQTVQGLVVWPAIRQEASGRCTTGLVFSGDYSPGSSSSSSSAPAPSPGCELNRRRGSRRNQACPGSAVGMSPRTTTRVHSPSSLPQLPDDAIPRPPQVLDHVCQSLLPHLPGHHQAVVDPFLQRLQFRPGSGWGWCPGPAYPGGGRCFLRATAPLAPPAAQDALRACS